MSQVRKLQNGKNVPDPNNTEEKKQYGHLILNGVDLGNSEELYNAFSSYVSTAPDDFRPVASSAQMQMRNGEDVQIDLDNTNNIPLPGVKKKDGYSTFRRGMSNVFGGQLDANLRGLDWIRKFQYSKPSEKSPEKKKISGERIVLDYNADGDNYVLAPIAAENSGAINRISTFFNNYFNDKDNSEYDVSNYTDNELAAIQALYDNYIKSGSNDIVAYINGLIPQKLTKQQYGATGDNTAFDALRAFRIYAANPSSSAGGNSNNGSAAGTGSDGVSGNQPGSGATTNGAYNTYIGQDGNMYTTRKFDVQDKPYVILPEDLVNFNGLNQEYEYAMIDPNTGIIYKYGSLPAPYEKIKNDITGINNSAGSNFSSYNDVLNAIEDYVQWKRPNGDSYFEWTPTNYIGGLANIGLNAQLMKSGNGRYLVSNISPQYTDSDGNKVQGLFEIFNLNDRGNLPFGFRSPTYLRRGNDFSFSSSNLDGLIYGQALTQRINGIQGKPIQFNDNSGNINLFEVPDTNSRLAYGFIDNKPVFFIKQSNNNNYLPLNNVGLNNSTLLAKIVKVLNGNRNYKIEGNDDVNKLITEVNNNKYQLGGSLRVNPTYTQNNLAITNPVQTTVETTEGDPFSNWTEADIQGVASAALDLGGAIAALIPGGGVASAGSGLAATGLFLNSQATRKGGWSNLDWGDWGNAILGTGLDALSLIPVIGAGPKMLKAAKTVSRVARPLGMAFNALGLKEAYNVISSGKNPSEWSADDLRAVMYGTQAVLNITNNRVLARQDSRLANAISNVEPAPRKIKVGDKEVSFSQKEIDGFKERGVTKEQFKDLITKKAGVNLDEKFNVDDAISELGLKQDSSKKYWLFGEKKTTIADANKKQEPTSAHEYLRLDPLGKRAARRIDVIDTFVSSGDNAKALASRFDNYTPEGKALARSLARLRLPGTTGGAYPRLAYAEENTAVPTKQTPVKQESVHVSSPTKSSIHGSETRNNPTSTPDVIRVAEDAKTTHSKFVKEEGITSNLGINSMSNRAIALAIRSKQMSPEATEKLLARLPEGRRNGVYSLLYDIEKLRKGSLKSGSEKLSRNTISRLATQQPRLQRAFEEKSKIASSIDKLKNSKNPMKTLQELSKDENFSKYANSNQESFREALNSAIDSYIAEKGYGAHQTANLKKQIRGFMNNHDLRFKEGGKIIKAGRGNNIFKDWSKYVPGVYEGILKGGQLASTLIGQDVVTKAQHKAIEGGVWKGLSQRFKNMSTATPLEDSAVMNYDEYVKRGLTTEPTNDAVVNTSGLLTLQNQALQGRNQAVRQQAAAQREIQKYNILAEDKTNTSELGSMNDYIARRASAKYQHGMADAGYRTQLFQSLANLFYEDRAKFDQDEQILNKARVSELLKKNQQTMDAGWKNYIMGNNALKGAWNEWNSLDANTRDSFEDYLISKNLWTPDVQDEYNRLVSAKLEADREIPSKTYIDPTSLWLHGYKANYKKGGRINGKTRYKLEPDEQVWVDQNKAAHRAVSQFNDNIIKAFLKTLK